MPQASTVNAAGCSSGDGPGTAPASDLPTNAPDPFVTYEWEVGCSSVDARTIMTRINVVTGELVVFESDGSTVVVDGSQLVPCAPAA